jgi:cobalt-precorrin 5A hydrolase
MGGDQAMIVAGLGCRRLCPAAEIVGLVDQAQSRAGCRVDLVAIPAFKADEPGPREAAGALGIGLVLVEEAALERAQPLCPTPSTAALASTGLASIAEACALAAAGRNGVLLLPKIASRRATCALAAGDLS